MEHRAYGGGKNRTPLSLTAVRQGWTPQWLGCMTATTASRNAGKISPRFWTVSRTADKLLANARRETDDIVSRANREADDSGSFSVGRCAGPCRSAPSWQPCCKSAVPAKIRNKEPICPDRSRRRARWRPLQPKGVAFLSEILSCNTYICTRAGDSAMAKIALLVEDHTRRAGRHDFTAVRAHEFIA